MKINILQDLQIQQGAADSLVFTTKIDGVAAAVSGATFEVFKGGTSEVTGTCTLLDLGANGQFTADFDGTEFDQVEPELRIVISATTASGVVLSNHLFMAVAYKAVTSVDDDLLKRYYPTLASELWAGETSYYDQILQAFNETMYKLRSFGFDGSMLVDPSQLDIVVAHKALQVIFAGFSRSTDDIWYARATSEKEMYDSALAILKLDIATLRDGQPNSVSKFATVRMVR